MLKSFKKIGFFLFIAACCVPLENFVDGKIIVTKTYPLNPNIIQKFSNESSGKPFSLYGAHEVAKSSKQSIIKNSNNEFFLFSQDNENCFNMQKIHVKSKQGNIKSFSFFFLGGKLYAYNLSGSTLNIAECHNTGSQSEGSDCLPVVNLIVDNNKYCASFNARNAADLTNDFKQKIMNNIQREKDTKGLYLSDCDQKNLSFDFSQNVNCCSECVVGNRKKGCFFLIQTTVKSGAADFVKINLGLFFDGKKIVPCPELASDNSYYQGNFNKFSITGLKSYGDTIACSCKELQTQNSSDFIAVGKLVLNGQGDVCYKLISSHLANGLRDFTFLQTKHNPILTIIFVDNVNTVRFGTLVYSDFRSQIAQNIVGIDLFATNAKLPERTRLRTYNLVWLTNGILAQLSYEEDTSALSTQYLTTFNKVEIPVFS